MAAEESEDEGEGEDDDDDAVPPAFLRNDLGARLDPGRRGARPQRPAHGGPTAASADDEGDEEGNDAKWRRGTKRG